MATKNALSSIYAGNRHVLQFTVVDEANALLDLTDYKAVWALSRSQGGAPVGDAVLTRTSVASSILFPDPTQGSLRVVLAQGVTVNLLGRYYWVLEIESPAGDKSVVASGELELLRNLASVG